MVTLNAGFCGFSCTAYPREITNNRAAKAKEAVGKLGIDLIDGGFSSTYDESDKVILKLKKSDWDFLIVCIPSWIETPIVMKVLLEFRHKPILLWGLGGYTRGRSLVSPGSQAGTLAIRDALERMGFNFKFIYEEPDAKFSTERILEFAKVVSTISSLKKAKIGMMGYADMGLYITMFDGVSLRSKIGPEIEVFDMLEVEQLVRQITEKEIKEKVCQIKRQWHFDKPVTDQTFFTLAQYYLAVEKIVIERGYAGVSLKCVDGMKKYMKFPPCLILSMIGDRVPAICEDDALGLVTQLMLKGITGQATTFLEIYELMKNGILMGACGYTPCEYIKGSRCASTYGGWGGLNQGVMNVSKMKTGRATLARLGYRGDNYFMHIVPGYGKDPGVWEELGWDAPAPQFPGLRFVPDVSIDDFAQKTLSQHYLIVYGDYEASLRDLCSLLKIEVIK